MSLKLLLTKPKQLIRQVFKCIPFNKQQLNNRLLLSSKMRFPFTASSRSISYLAIKDETIEERICRYECLFGREDADGWDVRQAMNDLAGYDSVPEPRIIIAALHACRRLNDYALSVRFLEMVKQKCGQHVDKIYPYIVQEVGPTVAELGCDFPENLGYDKPELWLESVYDM